MDASSALAAGLVAGLAIAVQVGAVSLLLIETALAAAPRAAVAAGMGVATADFAFALVAAVGGGAAGAALAGHESEIRIVAGALLAAIALHGLLAQASGGEKPAVARAGSARAHYSRFLAITAVNPLTIASFAAVAASLSLHGFAPYMAFVAGVGAASAGWHVCLTLTAAHAGRWVTPRVQRRLGIAGRLAILALAARLVLGA
ncbi:MAG TPA: LysE family transporter [Thermoleophilaceae bacterium]|nr:LysE family transporter [Thermoleophilaceae bacterium]